MIQRFDQIGRAIGERIKAGASVPLLVLRVPDFERIAWRDGRRAACSAERRTVVAFARSASRVLRAGDASAHQSGSDRFAIAMLEPPRHGRVPEASAVRTTLARIVAALERSTGRAVEGGWWPLRRCDELGGMRDALDRALERGARERQHGAVLATVGHELRTPLSSIRGYVETLLDEQLDAPTVRRFLETARREALRMSRTIDGLLEFSLLDLSTPEAAACCDVAQRIRAALDVVDPLAQRRNATIAARLPECAFARVDSELCAHAMLNLLENAVKHGRDGGRIQVECSAGERFAIVTVDDDGPGIAPHERDAIFGLGLRGSSAVAPGSGIGLALVRRIAERSGGDVRTAVSPLGGARFVLRFPR